MSRYRLDQLLTMKGLAPTRSQAESYIKLGKVSAEGKTIKKPGFLIDENTEVKVELSERYVSRAALKLDSVAEDLWLNFKDKVVLDIGSSTGGFTDYALQHGAKKVIAVDVGTNQLHADLRSNPLVELHEQTDIRDLANLSEAPDMVVMDVSFISLRQILPHVSDLVSPSAQIVAMAKPQFEAGQSSLKHKGVIKNDRIRREILKDFELWAKQHFIVRGKVDSDVAGGKGNKERFYLLQKAQSK